MTKNERMIRHSMRKIIAFFIIPLFLILLIPSCAPTAEYTDKTGISSQEYANDFTLLNLEGEQVSLSDYEGKLVVLNFWATWCPACREEIPDFIEVYNQYRDKGVQFLGVSNEDKDTLASFVDQYGINYPILIDGSVDTIMSQWGIRALPTTFILDSSGEVLESYEGLLTRQRLANEIEKRL